MNLTMISKAAALLAAGLLVGTALGAEPTIPPEKCVLQSSHFYADTGPAAPAAPGGVGRVWDQNYVLWTIASDYAGISAADRAMQVAEWRLVPWTEKGRTCGKHQVHVGMYEGNWVIYRATMAPYLPTADNVIVTVDPATARYHQDTPAHLAYYWWYRLSSFLQREVPAEKLPTTLETKAAVLESPSYEPDFDTGNMACGHLGECGCGLGENPTAGCATCGGPVPAPPGPPTP